MAFYGYNPQPKNYGYVALAGQQIAQGIEGVIDIISTTKDASAVNDARKKRIDEAINEYVEAVGKDTPEVRRRGQAIAAQRYLPLTGKEKERPELAVKRMDDADNKWYKEYIPQLKQQRYFEEVEGSPETTMAAPTGTPAGPGMAPEAQTTQAISPLSAQERYLKAQQLGISEAPQVKSDIERSSAMDLAGRNFGPGTTREQVASAAAGLPAYGKQSQEIVGSYPTIKEQAAEQRLSQSAEELAKYHQGLLDAKRYENALKSRKADENESLKITKGLADAQTDRLKLQLQAKRIEAYLTTANKQGFDKQVDPKAIEAQLEELRKINEAINLNGETENIYRDLLRSESAKNKKLSPESILPNQPLQQPQVPSLSGFQAWKANRK